MTHLSISPDPVKGLRFLHSRVIDYDKKPALYQVTRVAQGQVYYRPVYDAGIVGSERLGSPERCELDTFDRICLAPRVLTADDIERIGKKAAEANAVSRTPPTRF